MMDVQRLRKIPIFQRLAKSEQEALAQISTLRTISKGDELFSPGKTRKEFLVVLSGQVHIFRVFNDEVQTLAILDVNEFAVETALIDPNLKHEHNGEVLMDGELLVIAAKDFQAFRKEHPETAHRLYGYIIENLTERLHHANNKLITIYSTGKIAATYDNLDHLTDLILTTILKIIRAKRALFVIFEPLEGKAVVRDAKGYKDNQAMKNLTILLNSDPILGTLYRSPRDLFISEEQYQREKELHTAYASRNMLGTTLHIRKRVFGAILLGDKEGAQEFSHNNQVLLNIIARQIVLAVAIAELTEKQRI